MNWHSTRGKSGLVKMLMREHGISTRKAGKAVNQISDRLPTVVQPAARSWSEDLM